MAALTPGTYDEPDYPSWIREIHVGLTVRPQVVVTGNVRDQHLLPVNERWPDVAFRGTSEVLVDCLVANDFDLVLSYDITDGLTIEHEAADGQAAQIEPRFKKSLSVPMAPADLLAILPRIAMARRDPKPDDAAEGEAESPAPPLRCALIVDYASRLRVEGEQSVSEQMHAVFAAAAKFIDAAAPVGGGDARPVPVYNAVFWIVDRQQDLPYFLGSNSRMGAVSIPEPTLDKRLAVAERLAPSLPGYAAADAAEQLKVVEQFAGFSQGLSVRSMQDVLKVAIDNSIPASDVAGAVRTLRAGLTESTWQSEAQRARVAAAVAGSDDGDVVPLHERVLGQPAAVRQALDVLARSVAGLTGAHVGEQGNRPQGVLFFAGPTGVGKTELAKQLAQLVFGTADAYIRFDMSEFASDHSEARLIGAPPGYVGHDAGGELTNAVRQHPFSLLLFDEIEKASPRILDKFLQILEDGRLTDGSGATVYFGETLIVFTSNLGVLEKDPDTGVVTTLVRQRDLKPFDELDTIVRTAVERHFTERIQRPELLNRIGKRNIVVFDFIRDDVADRLADRYIDNVIERLSKSRGITLDVPAEVRESIRSAVTHDLDLGARGIGAEVEHALTNPLSRALLGRPVGSRALTVASHSRVDGGWEITLT